MEQKEKQENKIKRIESPLASAAALVHANGNMDVEKLDKLLEMQIKWEANEAKKSFIQAMSAFKENPPEILKDSKVNFSTSKGTTKYNHASLGNVCTCINKALSVNGLTASWVTSQDNGSVKITCKITHIMGHSEETSLSAPPDSTGSKNVIQAIGSTVTYLQRYTLLALTGLATYDQDDDGNAAGKKKELNVPGMKENQKIIMNLICDILEKEVPKDSKKIVDRVKVAAIFFSRKGYPENKEQTGVAASWLISLKRMKDWTMDK